jgi:hypothetical protein
MKISSQRGTTMLSMLFASTLLAIALVATLEWIEEEVNDSSAMNADKFVNTLHLATKSYYDIHCADTSFTQPTVSILASQGYLESFESVVNPIAQLPIIEINNVGTQTVNYRYTYVFDRQDEAEIAAGTASNAFASGVSVVWVFTNHVASTNSLTDNYEYLSAFGAHVC